MKRRTNYIEGAVGKTISAGGGDYRVPEQDRCRYCGKPFRPTEHQWVFCSYACEMAYFGREKVSLEDLSRTPEPKPRLEPKPGQRVDVCDVCGHPYIRGAEGQAWCSVACAEVAWSRAVMARRNRS